MGHRLSQQRSASAAAVRLRRAQGRRSCEQPQVNRAAGAREGQATPVSLGAVCFPAAQLACVRACLITTPFVAR